MHSRHHAFDPSLYAPELIAIIRAVIAAETWAPKTLDGILKQHPKDGKGFFARSELVAGYRFFAAQEGWTCDAEFLARIRLRPVRTQSGVTPVTVLTKPFPCPGECIFCPSDLRMPKSYLASEPGAQRAALNHFDPYLQTFQRLRAFHQMGHATAKIELIVLGGTWSFYPEPYQIWFLQRCFDALNDFGAGRDACAEVQTARLTAPVSTPKSDSSYNREIVRVLKASTGGELLAPWENASWTDLARAQHANETARTRCVGLVLETRPDFLDEAEVRRLRRLGATKIQVGVQTVSDEVLAAIRRGHSVAETRAAFRRLRAAGFKIHAHWMANLYGSSPQADIEDYAKLFHDPSLHPDELKIYPCSLIDGTPLMEIYRQQSRQEPARLENAPSLERATPGSRAAQPSGAPAAPATQSSVDRAGGRRAAQAAAAYAWAPYSDAELLEVLSACVRATPEYCRLTRIVRDIPSDEIVAGNKQTNYREVVAAHLAARGETSRDIRSREIRADAFDPASCSLRVTSYATDGSEEKFLQFVTPDERLVGFLRLSLPTQNSFIEELQASALIREVHVYGEALPFGARTPHQAQHLGFGAQLIAAAEDLARDAGFRNLAVISAVGTRDYYRRLGFDDGALYQHRALAARAGDMR